jgi:predicted ATP-dependent Lon-type protease
MTPSSWTPSSKRFFAELPAEIIDKLQIDFYSDPSQAALKALLDT